MIERIISILTLLFTVLLGLLVLIKNRKNKVNIVFSMLVFSAATWIFFNLLVDLAHNDYYLLMWSRATIIGAILMPMFFWKFSLIYPKGNILDSKKHIKITELLLWGVILIFFILIPTKYNIESASVITGSTPYVKSGPLYIFFLVYLIFLMTLGLVNLFRTYKRVRGVQKYQVLYVIIGVILTCAFAIFTNLILLLFGFSGYANLGPLFTIFLVGFTTYSIIKFRLMNIRLILTRGILYTVLVALVASFFAASVFITAKVFTGQSEFSRILVYIVASILIVVFLDPIKKFFAKKTDRIFYKDKIDYQGLLQKASSVVAKEIDLEKLSYSLTELLVNELKVKEVHALIADKEEYSFIISSQKNSTHFDLSTDFIALIKERKDYIIIDDLIRAQSDISNETSYYIVLDKFIREAESLNVEMVVPITDEKKVVSAIFLFSAKSSGDLYNQDDVNFLNVLVPQIATAIEKSKLYEEVQEFNRELKAKVDKQTKSLKITNQDLEQRNKFLIAMQGVTNMVSRTMDLKQVNQLIANSIATEFGYVGGILTFIDEKNNVLRIGAMTENEYSNEVVKILGQDPKDFEAKMNMRDLLGVKTVLSGQMNTSDKMSDFFSPPVDKVVIDRVQAKLGVKTIVGLPIFSEDKIIGIVHFLLAVEEDKFTPLDRDTMIALADQIGIVSRNLRLYNNLQATNQDLQVANMRLRELDQAKSEFLSIASHQLRTPISALKGYLSMISDGDFGTVPPKIGKVVKDLFESAARLARLVNIFLNVSRIESGRLKIEKKSLQIGDMIESVIAELHNESDKKGVKLIYKKPKPALALVAADADKLREVILNLIDNSIKYTPKGQIEVSALVENDNMHFKVQDTGIGIDPEEAKNLFRKFVRASGAAQIHTGGSGLGLFIAQKIIKEHGGQIWVESAGKEQGSIFQFVIPMIGGEPNKEEMQS